MHNLHRAWVIAIRLSPLRIRLFPQVALTHFFFLEFHQHSKRPILRCIWIDACGVSSDSTCQ